MSPDFTCNKCGKCCNCAGFVRVFPEDYLSMRDNLGILNTKEFLSNFFHFIIEEFHLIDLTLRIPRLVLKDINTGCIFSKNGLCSIHDFKPMICDTAPLNRSILINSTNKTHFKKICKPFRAIKSIPDNLATIEAVRTEIEFENRYYTQLETQSFRQIYQITSEIRWETINISINKNIDEVWGKEYINSLRVYEMAID